MLTKLASDMRTAADADFELATLEMYFDANRFGTPTGLAPFTVHVPEGWISRASTPWVFVRPEHADGIEQGWKVHVSSTEPTANQALSVVGEIAFTLGISRSLT